MIYQEVRTVGNWRIVRHPTTASLYLSWYDAATRQTRRMSLKTGDIVDAVKRAEFIRSSGHADPRQAGNGTRRTFGSQTLSGARTATVREVLELHREKAGSGRSAEAELLNIRLLQDCSIADRTLASLNQRDFERLCAELTSDGLAVSTVSRRLSTLRSAITQAVRNRDIDPNGSTFVPEFRTKAHIRSARPKGKICSIEELGRLYAACKAPHLRLVMFLLMNTFARLGAVLDLTADQLIPEWRRIELNPYGRIQTDKHRSMLPMTRQLYAWSRLLKQFDGPLVTYHGKKVARINTALRAAVDAAGLDPRVNTYSIRHSLARHMRSRGVDFEEVSLWLAHIQPPNHAETTLIYSPFEPGYLKASATVLENLIDEIGRAAGVNLSEPPPELEWYLRLERKTKAPSSNPPTKSGS